jgi:inhibitor of cysteine peptidase
MKRFCTVFLGLLVLSLLAGCISNEIKLGASDSGRQIELNKGQVLVITLEANPSTGYTWEIAELDTHVMHQIGETEFQPESNLLGAKGMQTLRFEAVNTGQTPLKLVYHRPWEKGVEPLQIFSIQVMVH